MWQETAAKRLLQSDAVNSWEKEGLSLFIEGIIGIVSGHTNRALRAFGQAQANIRHLLVWSPND